MEGSPLIQDLPYSACFERIAPVSLILAGTVVWESRAYQLDTEGAEDDRDVPVSGLDVHRLLSWLDACLLVQDCDR